MELCDGGDVLKKIEYCKLSGNPMKESELWKLFAQMMIGLKTLHDMHIVHRDIKCANLFLTKAGDLKIGDLNVSKIQKQGMMKTQTGTPYYASPEVWNDRPYNEKSDIWSAGCVLYEMIMLKPPFQATDMDQLFKKITRGAYPSLSA
jgi:NIMA (never in mitosis gene a)-related kinase 1/4/5